MSEGKLTDLEKLAVDGVIKRQQSLLDLMRHTDNRAQSFVVAYAGFMGAALWVAARDLKSSGFSESASLVFITYAVALLVATIFGLAACWSAKVGLASRSGDFWMWALREANHARAVSTFLSESEAHLIQNERLQGRAAFLLKMSMTFGAVAVLAASVGAVWIIADPA